MRDHDPALALDGGEDGLDAYRIIAANAAGHLAKGGVVGVEIGYDQLQVVGHVFEENGFRIVDRRSAISAEMTGRSCSPSITNA